MRPRTIAIILVFIISGFAISNRMSYQDELDDQAFKCQMISEGVWPDVGGYFEKVCKS